MTPRERFKKLFGGPKALIGMVHLEALPGTPKARLSVADITERAVGEAIALVAAGFDSVLLENMHDRPYVKGPATPEVTAVMAVVTAQVKAAVKVPVGVQVLAGANDAAIAVALAAGADYVRAEGFVFAHVADEGFIDGCAGPLLRYRRAVGADSVMVFTDIKKKHSSHAITGDIDISETAHAAEFFLTDGVIVTGISTGKAVDHDELRAVHGSVKVPVLIGSGITTENLRDYYDHADGFIVGSYIKRGGSWANDLDPKRMKALVAEYRRCGKGSRR